jgi:type IV pilus assembly protein PilM
MPIFDFFGKKRVLGIDLGSKHIKIVETQKVDQHLKLLNYSIVSLSWSEKLGRLLDTPQTFEDNLGQLLIEATKPMKTRDCVFVLPATLLFSSFFSLPLIAEKNLASAITYETSKYIPVSAEEIELSWRAFQFQNPYQGGQARWLIFLVAAPKSLIEKFKNASLIANLNFKQAVPDFFSIEPFLTDTAPKVIVDIGNSFSLFLVFHRGKIIYGKKLQFKLSDIIQIISRLMNVNFDRAEEVLLERGLAIPPEEDEMRTTVFNVIDQFVSELQQNLSDVEEKFNIKVEQLLFTGGMTLLPSFEEVMVKRFTNITFGLLDPFERVELPEKFKSSGLRRGQIFTQALGACVKYFFE